MKQSALTVTIYDQTNWQEVEAEWAALTQEAIEPNPFFGPAFIKAYQRHMTKVRLKLIMARETGSGRALATLPVLMKGPLPLLKVPQGLAGDYGPLGTLLLAPDAPKEALEQVIETALQLSPWNMLVLPFHSNGGLVQAQLKEVAKTKGWQVARSKETDRAFQRGGEAGFEALQQALASKSGKRIQRYGRQLEKQGELAFSASSTAEEALEGLEAFLDLEQKGWKGHQGSALIQRSNALAFTREMFAQAAQNEQARVDQMTLAGEPVAIKLWLAAGKRWFGWKTAFNEAYSKVSPGTQLLFYSSAVNLRDPGFNGADSLTSTDNRMANVVWQDRFEHATLTIGSGLRFTFAKAVLTQASLARQYAIAKIKGLLGKR
ncbi:GNAT family N-acetyltransferase [Pseudovibrio sp. SPO723]|uniref:GNAT family N-acetyltransferase n=1 Tax=Nesiotobacter zosterae TaxID=392721 RepID=UPI0029C2A9E1|nr:GNAT family N-acetyltransferase [Pseudovibrio sp. SPO723]MDX5594933.1 GNAT family N-acetyltransferase [Pseudovibrio sp. SPO723]